MPSPLFPNSNRRQAAERKLETLRRELTAAQKNPQQILQAAQSLRQSVPTGNRVVTRILSDIVADARKALRDGQRGALAGFLGQFGPAGRILSTALDLTSQQVNLSQQTSRLDRAAGLLQQLAGDANAPNPEAIGGKLITGSPVEAKSRRAGDPSALFDAAVEKDEGLPPNVESDGAAYVKVKVGIFSRRYRRDDPILSGKMIPVQSSNVHSIGYRMNFRRPLDGRLIVRYLQNAPGARGSRAAKVPGPMYAYSVAPDTFTAMKKASSKGKFVWDEFRIRGSRVGHKVPYRLIGVSGGHVPRQATVIGKNEAFRKRSVTNKAGRKRTSGNTIILGRARPNVSRQAVGTR